MFKAKSIQVLSILISAISCTMSPLCYAQQYIERYKTGIDNIFRLSQPRSASEQDSIKRISETLQSHLETARQQKDSVLIDALGHYLADISPVPTLSQKSLHARMAEERVLFRKSKGEALIKYKKSIDASRSLPTVKERESRRKEVRDTYSRELNDLDRIRNDGYASIYDVFVNDWFRLWPSRNTKFSSLYYKELKENSSIGFLRNQFLSFGEEFGSLSSEIVSGHFLFLRLSLGTAVSRVVLEDIDTEVISDLPTDQIQKYVDEKNKENLANATLGNVVAGGGQLSFKGQVPVFSINGNATNVIQVDSELVPSLSCQLSKIGTSIPEDDVVAWWGLGSETRISVPFKDYLEDGGVFTSFGLFAEYDVRFINGSGAFQENLQIDQGFWMNEFKAGIFAKGIQVSYNLVRFSDSNLDGKYQNRVMIAFAPQLK